MTWRGSPPLDRESVLPALKYWVPKLVDPWKSAIEWISDDTILDTQRISFWHPITRDNWDGRVTLVGDAAHPMVPCKNGQSQ
jgi:2-polyprenyl-6-methoxyphenol hydroxylase-like FAD-dependent oxidoreductase